MPESRWAGVEVGLTVPGSFGAFEMSPDDILDRTVRLGLGVVELQGHVIERLLGVPCEPTLLHPAEGSFETGLLPIEEEVFRDEVDLARATFAMRLRDWRASVSLAPLDVLRRRFDDAGVRIAVLQWDDLSSPSDDEIDFAFRVTHAVGALAVSTGLPHGGVARLGAAAARRRMRTSIHGDEGTSAEAIEAALGHATSIGTCLDIGSWSAAELGSPLPFLTRHADRITHLYLSDRRTSDAARTHLGEGDAPIHGVLGAMRDNAWTFPALIDVGYHMPDDSQQMTAIATSIDYCRRCLMA